jgi:ABC-type Fe3+/spermidine/putrescine transport system ATPase subunit
MIRVVLDGLVKHIDRVAVVDGVTMEIRPGELTYLLGPSGSGKSMVARLIAGLDTLEEGEIYFDGRPMRDLKPADRKVGLVFQRDALWPHLSVAGNVGYGLKVRGVARRERRKRVTEALGLLRIDSLADRRPASLSPSQRRRVALARALVIEPDVLLLDEPSAGLQGPNLDEWHEELKRLHAESETTTLVLSADPGEALAMADRLAVIDLGRILQVGTPPEVYHRPADSFVARFVGPTNLLQGQLEAADANGEAVVRTPLGRLVGQSASQSARAVGGPVMVAIRHEALSLGSTPQPNANRFAATVERQVFRGELREIHLRGPGDWPVTALVLQSPAAPFREGQNVTVSVPPSQVLVLPSRLGRLDETA